MAGFRFTARRLHSYRTRGGSVKLAEDQMSDKSEDETPVAAPAPAAGEPLDLNGALALVLKKALSHDGLSRGLNESANLLSVKEAQQLGTWAGLCKLDPEGEPRKVVKCSAVAVTDYGEETEGYSVLQDYLKKQ
ncbi:hypothetical protein WJX73_000145 [Symbiochloris irregularis]|uniref:40S ribosomal protein S12 n=1 Tax=Symbiochloris irregularis TaxID=706552 RepID=A0AAW1NQ98_9CHLO